MLVIVRVKVRNFRTSSIGGRPSSLYFQMANDRLTIVVLARRARCACRIVVGRAENPGQVDAAFRHAQRALREKRLPQQSLVPHAI
jgi:hypothetical protein